MGGTATVAGVVCQLPVRGSIKLAPLPLVPDCCQAQMQFQMSQGIAQKVVFTVPVTVTVTGVLFKATRTIPSPLCIVSPLVNPTSLQGVVLFAQLSYRADPQTHQVFLWDQASLYGLLRVRCLIRLLQYPHDVRGGHASTIGRGEHRRASQNAQKSHESAFSGEDWVPLT